MHTEQNNAAPELSVFDPRQALSNPGLYCGFIKSLRRNSSMTRFVELLKIRPGCRVLDIGCGPADILAYLPTDIEYHGYDLNKSYIAAAKRRFGNRGSFAVRALSPNVLADHGTFDLVMSIGVLHHLADAQVEIVFTSALRVLRPGGRVITCDGAYVKGQNPIARILLALDRGRYVRRPEDYLAFARRYFSDAKATVFHDFMAIPYTHCIIEASRPLSA
jgi:cyclopropane fatty-acyl-phospholipid synthase-like methyltransferase